MSTNERQWQGWVLRQTSELLKQYLVIPLNKVGQEFEVMDDGKMRWLSDLTLFDKQGKPICVFELKPLDRISGRKRKTGSAQSNTYLGSLARIYGKLGGL